MLKGEKLVFIRSNKIEGTNATTKKDYAFANVTVSDGLESVELPIDINIEPRFHAFKRGDKINLDIQVTKRGHDTNILVTDVRQAQ